MVSRGIFLLTFFLISFSLQAQLKLDGKVIDENGVPIKGAEVILDSLSTNTNQSGYFSFENLQAGEYVLEVIWKGKYETRELNLIQDRTERFALKRKVNPDAGTSSLFEVRKKELSRLKDVEGTEIYAGRKTEVVELAQVLGNKSTGNPREVYAAVSGLNVYESSRAGLQLSIGGRGLDPRRSANFNIRQNGYDISADVLGYPESYYTPPVVSLKEIQVVRGAAALQYGTQFGGLINFKLKDPSKKKIAWESRQTAGSFGLIGSYNRISGTTGDFTYQAYYNFKTGGGFRDNSNFDSHNLFGQVSYHLSKKTKLTFESTFMNYIEQQPGGLTDEQFELNPDFSNRTRNFFQVNWQLYALRLDHSFSKKSLFSLQLFTLDASRKSLGFRGAPILNNQETTTEEDVFIESQGQFASPRDLIIGEYKNWGAEARYLFKHKLISENSAFLIGAKYYQSDNQSIQGPGSRNGDEDFTIAQEEIATFPNQSNIGNPNLNFAGFSEYIIRLGKKVSVTPGVRWEYLKTESDGEVLQANRVGTSVFFNTIEENRLRERNFWLFGVGLSYKPNRKTEFYGNISENYRSITFSDLNIINSRFIFDPEIQDATGYSVDLGVRGKLGKALSYDANFYRIFYDNRIGVRVITDSSNPDRGAFQTTNIGSAEIYGIESFLNLDLLKFVKKSSIKWGSSVFLNMAISESQYLESDLASVQGNQVEFVPQFNIKTGLRLSYKNLRAGLQLTYLSDQFTDGTNATLPSADGVEGIIPTYQVMDLSLQYKWKKFVLEGGVNNLLDEDYFTQRASGYPGPGIIPSDPRNYYISLGWKI